MKTVQEVAEEAMAFVEREWSYYDRDWGRVRCHFCGHSYCEGNITHAKDCRYISLKTDWEQIQQQIKKDEAFFDEE